MMQSGRLLIHALVAGAFVALLGFRTVAAQGTPPPPEPPVAAPQVQLSLLIAEPVRQPGEPVTLLARVDNSGAEAVAPEILLPIPAGLASDATDLPSGTTLNLQTNEISWFPVVEARGGSQQITLTFVIATADLAQPAQAITAYLLHNGAQRSATASFWVGVLPTIAPTLTPLRVAVGQPVQLQAGAAGPGPLRQLWDTGDGRIIAAANPTISYARAGTYLITVEVSNPLGTVTAQVSLTVFPETVASFTVEDPQPGVDLPVHFVNLSGGEPPLSFAWDMGDGTLLTSTHPTHTYSAAGTYLVQLTTSNGFGSATTSWELTVGEPPALDFSAPPPAAAGAPVALTAVHDGSATRLLWDFGDGTQLEGQNVTHVFRDAGDYYVTLIAENAYGSATAGRWLTITPGQWTLLLPVAPVTTTPPDEVRQPGDPLPEQAPLAGDASLPEQLLWYVNEARRLHGLPAVDYSYALSIAAQQHTADMATFGFTGHTGSDGSAPPERQIRFGYRGDYAGEATAWGFDSAMPVVEFWVNSPAHRDIVLNPAASEIGVGLTVNYNAPNVWYWTVEFGISRPDS